MPQLETTISRASLRLFLRVNVGATVLCLAVEWICHLLRLPATYVDPFFIGMRFFDFDCFQQRFQLLHTAQFFSLQLPFHFNYLPSAIPLFAPFYAVGVDASLNVFLAFTLIVFLVAAALLARGLYRRGLPVRAACGFIAAAVAMAFPFWFCFQRANLEILLFALVAAGLWCFVTGRGYLAAAAFGLAASVKIVPVLYLALLLPRRQYRQFAFGILFAVGVTVAALQWAGPTIPIAWHGIMAGLDAFRRQDILASDPNAIGFDHSLLGLYRRFLPLDQTFATLLRFYTPAVAVAGTILFFTRIRRMPLLNQFLCLCVAAIWLPPVSFDYTLLYLYAIVALLLLARTTADVRAHLVLLAVLVSPLSELIWNGVRFGGQIKSLLLGALFVLALTRPIPSGFDERVETVGASPARGRSRSAWS